MRTVVGLVSRRWDRGGCDVPPAGLTDPADDNRPSTSFALDLQGLPDVIATAAQTLEFHRLAGYP